MVKPITIPSAEYQSFREYRQNNIGPYFVLLRRNHVREVNFGLLCDNGDHFSGWSIILWGTHNNYKIGEMTASKAECLDFIAKNHPDYFEWIIWNLDILK